MSVPVVTRPPRYVEALLQSLGAGDELVDDVLGDLADEYLVRLRCDGGFAARLWYYGEALRTAPHLLSDWRRRFGRRDAGAVAAAILFAFLVGFAADAMIVVLLGKLTFLATGIPLGAYINHWVSTGDEMPWLTFAFLIRRTMPAMISGMTAVFFGGRAPLATSLLLAALIVILTAAVAVVRSATLGTFGPHVFSYAASLGFACLVGGTLAALLLHRRRSSDEPRSRPSPASR